MEAPKKYNNIPKKHNETPKIYAAQRKMEQYAPKIFQIKIYIGV